jgi:hypothetical protein
LKSSLLFPKTVRLVRSSLFCVFLVSAFGACERKPTAEEVEAARQAEAQRAQATPEPKPGDWMWKKDRKTPLDQKAQRK